jgi:hypothetical protein
MSDKYEFHKSSGSQDIDEFSPYEDKKYNSYVNDLNGDVYTNSSLTLVQSDMGQIFNSNQFSNTEDLVLVLPIIMVEALSTAAAAVASVSGNSALLSIIHNFINLIHHSDIHEMKTIGPTIGFGDDGLDNHRKYCIYTCSRCKFKWC